MKIFSALFFGAVFVTQTWSYSEIGTFTMGQGCLLCTEEYEPICGANGEGIRKTFGNDCELVEWNCLVEDDYKHISHGICSESLESGLLNGTCTIVCPDNRQPNCGCAKAK
ncbi:vasotab-like isoform X3 [Agrilus planipennis]|uniref:Vasotab-like isoform X3 n=1 Tax=Agrilus planipennis TaxID=224129 RepID=A0A1W4WX36_AGRPL|nr:vasotab-like isoform X3 [Agrilus planipennis]